MNKISTEVYDRIFSYLPYLEVYRLRAVSKPWQQMAEMHIYMRTRSNHDTVTVQLALDETSCLSLIASYYDPDHKVIEFRPSTGALGPCPGQDAFAKIHFTPWTASPEATYSGLLLQKQVQQLLQLEQDPNEQFVIRINTEFNPALEQMHVLSAGQRLIAHRGLMLSYVHERQQPIRIEWLRVTLAWLVSGFDPNVPVDSIYPAERTQLQTMLAHQHSVFRYEPSAEPVLRFLLNPSSYVPPSVLEHASTHVEDDASSVGARLRMIERALAAKNLDIRILWKYSFVHGSAQRFTSSFDKVVDLLMTHVQTLEERWKQKKRMLLDKARREGLSS